MKSRREFGWRLSDDARDLAVVLLVDADQLSHGVGIAEEAAGQGLGEDHGVGPGQGRLRVAAQEREAEDLEDAVLRHQHPVGERLLAGEPELRRPPAAEADRLLHLGQLLLEGRAHVDGQTRVEPAAAPRGTQDAVDAVPVLVEGPHGQLVGGELDDQQTEGEAEGESEDVDRRVPALPPQQANGRCQVVSQHDPSLSSSWFPSGPADRRMALTRPFSNNRATVRYSFSGNQLRRSVPNRPPDWMAAGDTEVSTDGHLGALPADSSAPRRRAPCLLPAALEAASGGGVSQASPGAVASRRAQPQL